MLRFRRGQLDNIERITIRAANPLSKTISGRLEMANLYVNAGMITSPEQVVEVTETGQIQSFVQSAESQMQVIRDENEHLLELVQNPMAMFEGSEAPNAMATDNHVLHIREHAPLLNSTESRRDPNSAGPVLAHIMQHIQLMSVPNVQMISMTLGYPVMGMGAPQPGMGGPGGPPAGNGSNGKEPRSASQPSVPSQVIE